MSKTISWNDMKDAPRDGRRIIALHRIHGIVEASFEPGRWEQETPVTPEEYYGPVWIIGDDLLDIEVEEYGPEAPEPFHDGELIGWLPREALPGMITG